MTFEVIVELKSEVLDAQGRAIRDSLNKLGHSDLRDIKVSKRFVVEMDHPNAEHRIGELAAEFLANPVSETFKIKRLDA